MIILGHQKATVTAGWGGEICRVYEIMVQIGMEFLIFLQERWLPKIHVQISDQSLPSC